MIQLSATQIAVIVVVLGVIQLLLTEFLKARITESIKSEYAQLLEEYKYDIKVREQAAKVAEYLAKSLDSSLSHVEKNRLSWELSLWLPAEIYQKMAVALCESKDAKAYKELLITVRRLLLKNPDDALTWDNIIHTGITAQAVSVREIKQGS